VETKTHDSSKPLFILAAWYSIIAPVIIFLSIFICMDHTTDHNVIHDLCAFSRWVCLSGLISGVVSLSGVRRCGAKRILPVAIAGIIFSVVVGFIVSGLMVWTKESGLC
jgi:hypothetical protein